MYVIIVNNVLYILYIFCYNLKKLMKIKNFYFNDNNNFFNF